MQAQARCHRIGQKKDVKIYRLVTRNTYEREMFDRAGLKLGLDKAVLQSMNTDQGKNKSDGPGPLSKKEIEDLLKKGAYGALMDDDNAGDKVKVLFFYYYLFHIIHHNTFGNFEVDLCLPLLGLGGHLGIMVDSLIKFDPPILVFENSEKNPISLKFDRNKPRPGE